MANKVCHVRWVSISEKPRAHALNIFSKVQCNQLLKSFGHIHIFTLEWNSILSNLQKYRLFFFLHCMKIPSGVHCFNREFWNISNQNLSNFFFFSFFYRPNMLLRAHIASASPNHFYDLTNQTAWVSLKRSIKFWIICLLFGFVFAFHLCINFYVILAIHHLWH